MDPLHPVEIFEMLEALGESVWYRDFATDRVWATSGVWTALGHPKSSMPRTNEEALQYFHPSDAAMWDREIRQYVRSGERSFHLEVRVRDAAGAWRTLRFRGCVIRRTPASEALTVGGILSDVTQEIADQQSKAEARHALAQLSARERQVLVQMMSGATNKQIAASLGLSPRTVEFYRARMLEKLGVKALPALARLCAQAGALSEEPPAETG